MVEKREWSEFKETGLLWWINMILHTFGWAIVLEIDDEKRVKKAYPARVKFRGFNEKTNTQGYIKVSNFIMEHAED